MNGGTDLRFTNQVVKISGLVLVAVGAIWAVGSLVAVWQAESHLVSSGYNYPIAPNGAPSLADRIVAGEQAGFFGLFALLLVAAGIGLYLAARHLPDVRAAAPTPAPPLPPVIEVPLEAEEQVWGRVGPRPDEDPFRH